MDSNLAWKPQEIPLDHPDSCNMFQPSPAKPFLATATAIERFQYTTLMECLIVVQWKAKLNDGLDYLQVFIDEQTDDKLWLIEDGGGGAITALLPEDY